MWKDPDFGRNQGQTDLEDFGKRGVMALRASQRLRELVAVAGVHSSTPTFVGASGLCVAISKIQGVQTVDLGQGVHPEGCKSRNMG